MKYCHFVFLLPILCFSHTIRINTDQPNSSGMITLTQPMYDDTIIFSNGVTIRTFKNEYTLPHAFLELVWGIVFDSNTNLIKVGLKEPETLRVDMGGIYLQGMTSDTNWIQSGMFPETLYSTWSKYYYQETFKQKDQWGSLMKNYNSIIYAQTVTNCMVIQISKIFHNPPDSVYESSLDRIQLSWKVDSLGNGEFHTSTRILNRKPKILPKSYTISKELAGFRDFRQNNGNLFVYSIDGKRAWVKSLNTAHRVLVYK